MDGYTIAAIFVLLHRSGLSSAGTSPLTPTHALDTAVAIAFMLAIKMDKEALDRFIEKGLWYISTKNTQPYDSLYSDIFTPCHPRCAKNSALLVCIILKVTCAHDCRQILASFIFFGTVPELARSGLEEHYLATNPRLDEKRKLLLHEELSFLRRKVPDSAMIRTQTKGEVDMRQVFMQHKNDCGERNWELLSEILVLMFDIRSLRCSIVTSANATTREHSNTMP
jgi:hypothetical protein